jgi:hypothetical protein
MIGKIRELRDSLESDEFLKAIDSELASILAALAYEVGCSTTLPSSGTRWRWPCSLTRWQGRLLFDAATDDPDPTLPAQSRDHFKHAANLNGNAFRTRVDDLCRAARAGIVSVKRRGSYELTEHGTLFD